MPDLADLQRQLGELRRDLNDVRTESRINSGTLATAIRKTRQQIAEPELVSSIRRGRPSIAARLWDPKSGEFVQPDLDTSLISRLRKGDSVSNTLGEAQANSLGLRNMFTDPLFRSAQSTVLSGVAASISKEWTAMFTSSAAGVAPNFVAGGYENTPHVGYRDNPFIGAVSGVIVQGGTGAGTTTIILRRAFQAVTWDPTVLPWGVFSVMIYNDATYSHNPTGLSSVQVQLRIRDSGDTTTLAQSPPLDWLTELGSGEFGRLYATIDSSNMSSALQLQIVFTITHTASQAGFSVKPAFAETQWELAPYPSPTPFTIGTATPDGSIYWVPPTPAGTNAQPFGIRLWTDNDLNNNPRVAFRVLANDAGAVLFGANASPDVSLSRQAANVLRLGTGSGTGGGVLESQGRTAPPTPNAGYGDLYFSSATKTWHQVDDAGVDTDLAAGGGGGATQVSRDAAAAAADYVARIRLTTDTTFRAFLGLDSSDRGSLEFGPGGVAARDVRMFRSAANELTVDDTLRLTTAETLRLGASGSDVILQRIGAGTGRFTSGDAAADSVLQVLAQAAKLAILDMFVSGDSVPRAELRGDATLAGLELGSGAATRDIRLFRNAAGNLALNSAGAAVQTTLQINSTAGQRAAIGISVTGDAANRLALFGDATNAEIQWGPGSAARDLRLYRSAAKTLTLDDTAAGNVTLNVIGTLQQSGTAVSVAGHGPADHADVTRSVILTPEEATIDGTSTIINVGASPNLSRAVNYPNAATSGAFWTFQVPTDWASGVLSIAPIWTPAATDAVAHTVRWSVTAKNIGTGTDVTAAGTTNAWTGASAARTVNIMVVDTAQNSITPASAGIRVMLELQRIGADAADTYVGAVRLHAVLVSYTANQ